jgi:hypothetical protein
LYRKKVKRADFSFKAYEKFEDIKVVIRSQQSMKDRKCKDQQKGGENENR